MTSDWIADCDVIAASIAAIGSLIAMCIPHSDKIAVWLVQIIIIKSQLQMTKKWSTNSREEEPGWTKKILNHGIFLLR